MTEVHTQETMTAPATPARPRTGQGQAPAWLHGWAVLTLAAALPLLLLGAEVTTKKVGMVDPQGFRPPWHMLTVTLQERGLGYVVEHSHRLAGFVVGSCIIVLAVGLWLREPRRWVRWLGVGALAAVCVQGLLGGFRVQLNALVGPQLALIHGCFAAVVFSLLALLVAVTARGWTDGEATQLPASLRRGAVAVAALLYLQLVLGALVRHANNLWAPRLHLLCAFAVTAGIAWLANRGLSSPRRDPLLVRTVKLLLVLMVLQLPLGLESWLARFPVLEHAPVRPLSIDAAWFRSLHYLVGVLLFATSAVAGLQANRCVRWTADLEAAPAGRLEGAA